MIVLHLIWLILETLSKLKTELCQLNRIKEHLYV